MAVIVRTGTGPQKLNFEEAAVMAERTRRIKTLFLSFFYSPGAWAIALPLGALPVPPSTDPPTFSLGAPWTLIALLFLYLPGHLHLCKAWQVPGVAGGTEN